jgi:DNA-binding MarR family transcriptional regulator
MTVPRTDSAVPPVGDQLDIHGLPLTALVARLSYQLARELADAYARNGITAQPLDASLLVLLAQGSARLTALAARLNTSKQALTFVIDRLERDGYVTRAPDPKDRRAKQIQLTTTGREAAELSTATLTRVERNWRALVADWSALRAGLADIAADYVTAATPSARG